MLFITMHSNSLVPQQKLAEYRFNETLMLLRNLMDALYADPPEHDQIDPASLAQAMKAGLEPIAEYRH